MNGRTDQELLREYAGSRSEAAFAELVRRHLDLVHSAALRMVCDAHLAQDVSQGVFVALAQQAGQLTDRPVLVGWLHRTAQNLAARTVRTEVRRRGREQEASAMNASTGAGPDSPWEEVAPQLDHLLGELKEADRDALLLRYGERKSAREVAALAGISEEAAQKRVSRALERLRELLAAKGVAVSLGALMALLGAHAVQAAPAGLAAAALAAGTALPASTAIATAKVVAMTTLQKTLIAATVVAGLGTGLYQAHLASGLRAEVRSLRQEQAPLRAELALLSQERNAATNRLASLLRELDQLKGRSQELGRLRARTSDLRRELDAAAEETAALADPETRGLLDKRARLKDWATRLPDKVIPEMELLTSIDWLNVAKDADLQTERGARTALARLRQQAKAKFADAVGHAVGKYAHLHDNQAPPSAEALLPLVGLPVAAAALPRYEPVQSGDLAWDQPAVAEKAAVDAEDDRMFKVGADGFWWQDVRGPHAGESGKTGWGTNYVSMPVAPEPAAQPKVSQHDREEEDFLKSPDGQMLAPALGAYQAQHAGNEPATALELVPYLTSAEAKAAFKRFIDKGLKEPGLTPAQEADMQAALKALQP
jgi:RNA polymerase sigma factor (sigma-70 family)